MAIEHLAFLTPVAFPDVDAAAGMEANLALFAYAEDLGFQSGWVRQRHFENHLASAVVFLAAAAQRTRHLQLGTAVIPLGFERIFPLAEQLSVLDAIAGGRLEAGISSGQPVHGNIVGAAVIGEGWDRQSYGFEAVEDLLACLRGRQIGAADVLITSPNGIARRPQVRPHRPGVADRLWYGTMSRESTIRAAQAGLAITSAIVVKGAAEDDFQRIQTDMLRLYHEHFAGQRPRAMIGRTILPLDSADGAARRRLRDYAAGELTLSPAQGGFRKYQIPDYIGTSEQILDMLHRDQAVQAATELRIELPYDLPAEECRQLLYDFRTGVAPALGWTPPVRTTTPRPEGAAA